MGVIFTLAQFLCVWIGLKCWITH